MYCLAPITIIANVGVLFWMVHYPAFAGVAVLIILVALNGQVSFLVVLYVTGTQAVKLYVKAQEEMMKMSDKRISNVTELLEVMVT